MSTAPYVHDAGDYVFTWDLAADDARLVHKQRGLIWQGGLLPLFWVRFDNDWHAIAATVDFTDARTFRGLSDPLPLRLGRFGTARLQVSPEANGLRFTALAADWAVSPPPAIHSWYFGARVLTSTQRLAVPTLDRPFWPSWRAEGFAVASAKTNPMQSFFRSWDFGHADIALGSFGPAMGTPYSAAFPRPIYGGCVGGRNGWACFGAGTVPDAALTFQVRSRSAALEWRGREDLWGAPAGSARRWEQPLWITWAATAWEAYRDYFRLFPKTAVRSAHHQKSFWGTWGDFRLNQFEWRSSVDRARDEMEADLICIDDPWEESKGSCRPHPERLPTFAADLAYAHQRKLGMGIWMPLGWIEDPAAAGLTTADLLMGRDGEPVRSNWAVDPDETSMAFFCLDPSSPGARRYLRERTQRVMRDYRPTLLKVDFGYGVPGPDACAARDPAWRGERIAWAYAKLVADAAREIDPQVTLLGYSIHPLWADVNDEISLDDLGDAGAHEAGGHGQWSIWAALAADRGMALMGSSGYLWEADSEILLNSAILGAPGANLPRVLPQGAAATAQLARRRALFRWFRRTVGWSPLWLDSAQGSIEQEPTPRNWGRLEPIAGQPQLTALALREPSAAALAAPELQGLSWTGRWILIAQDDCSIFESKRLAIIALSPGTLRLPRPEAPRAIRQVWAQRERDHAGGHWANGALELTATEAELAEPMLGLLIDR